MTRNCDAVEGMLDDHLDGLLRTEERAEVDLHLRGCAGCRSARQELAELRQAARSLPASLPPPRDLWPGIRARIPSTEPAKRPGPASRVFSWRPLLAAAAVFAVAAAAVLALLRPAPGPTVDVAPAGLGSYGGAEAEYARAADELMAALEARRSELAPGTLEIVDENLQIIDQAIRDVRAALERDPASPGAGHRFTSLHAKKVALLQQVVRLPAAESEGGTS